MNSKAIKRQLLAAIAMVLVAALALGSSTYAWFANNDMVTADGLKATAQSGASALLIANNESGITDKSFKTSVQLETAAKKLAPVSTIDGQNFYWTDGDNVNGIGDAIADEYTLYNDDTMSTFPSGAVPYIEYDLLLKATLSEEKPINLTALTLNYDNGTTEKDEENAFRVAFFVSEKNDSVESAKKAETTLKSIMNSQNTTTNFTEGKAVSATNALDTVQVPGVAAQVTNKVTAGEDCYYRVIVRLWIEGEDITCTNTVFNPLTGTWACGLQFETKGTAVTNYTAGGDQPQPTQPTV